MALTAVNDGGSRGRPVPDPVKAAGSDRPSTSSVAFAAGLSGGAGVNGEARLPAFSELLANILGSQETGGQRPEAVERTREPARSRAVDRERAVERERPSTSAKADRGESAARDRPARQAAEASQGAADSETRAETMDSDRVPGREAGQETQRETTADRAANASEAADGAGAQSQAEAGSTSRGDGTGQETATATQQQVTEAAASKVAVPVILDSVGQQLATGTAVATASVSSVVTVAAGQAMLDTPLGNGQTGQQLQADVQGGSTGQGDKANAAGTPTLVDATAENAKQGPSSVTSLAQQVMGESESPSSGSSLQAARQLANVQPTQPQEGQGNPALAQTGQVEAAAVPAQAEEGGAPSMGLAAQAAAAKAAQASAGRAEVSVERVENNGPSRAEVTTPPVSTVRRGDSSAGASRVVDMRPTGGSSSSENPTLERVRVAIAKLQAKGGGSAKIVLHPPKLGTLRIQVQARDGVVWASFEPESMAARHVLVQNQDVLRDALSRQGLELGGFEVSTGGAEGQGEDPLAQKGAQADQGEDGAGGSGQAGAGDDPDDPGGGNDGGDGTGDGRDRPARVNLVA